MKKLFIQLDLQVADKCSDQDHSCSVKSVEEEQEAEEALRVKLKT